MMKAFSFEGRAALVTGSSQGIGLIAPGITKTPLTSVWMESRALMTSQIGKL